ncbi:glycosyl hydrolase family 8 [Solicola sp. PLA-1-18]|uniref:glycosyl hydrolase family 8 n=1 Tax=Solicola sp. PLA-1-18 TaxID=3380532 RepID=UPI003B81823A
MTLGTRARRSILLGTGVLAIVVAVLVGLALRDTGSPTPGATSGGEVARVDDADPSASFLKTYVDPDGRVVRRDQGDDTVSEGQAYGMLVAAGSGDRDAFDRIWTWTQQNVLRPDGLIAWRWADGAVADDSSASDADLDAAHALVAAGREFDEPRWTADGVAMGQAVLDVETKDSAIGRVMTAGSWDQTAPYSLNPSYTSQLAIARLDAARPDPRWDELAAGQRALLDGLDTDLPPDWVKIEDDGRLAPLPPPATRSNGSRVEFGLDAVRTPIREATACEPQDVTRAADWAPLLVKDPADVRGTYDLGGSPTVEWQHPVALAAAASSAAADGDATAEQALMERAVELDAEQPTYYGSAWVALTSELLQDDNPLGCDAAGTGGRS